MVAIGDYGKDFKLRDLFENVSFLRGKGVFDTILRGLTNSQAQTVDNNVVSDVRNTRRLLKYLLENF